MRPVCCKSGNNGQRGVETKCCYLMLKIKKIGQYFMLCPHIVSLIVSLRHSFSILYIRYGIASLYHMLANMKYYRYGANFKPVYVRTVLVSF